MNGQGTLTLATRAAQPTGEAPLIELERVEKTYRMGKVDYRALRGVDLSVASGELVTTSRPSCPAVSSSASRSRGRSRPIRS